MYKIKTIGELKSAILEMESKRSNDRILLQSALADMVNGITPMSLLKNSLRGVAASTDLKNNVLGSVIGLAAGYLSKGLIGSGSPKAIRNMASSLLQVEVATVVAQNFNKIKSIAATVAGIFRRKKKIQLNIVDNKNRQFS